jgi:ribosomal protein S6--L-glutamate ligase
MYGVDILHVNSGPIVMKVNSSPGLSGIETAAGNYVACMCIQFLEKMPNPTITK